MKRFFKTLLLTIVMIITCATSLSAQTTNKQRISREQLAEVQAKTIAYKLAFTEPITSKFVKTFCAYQKEIWALGPRQKSNKVANTDEANEADIKQRFALSEKILTIRQKYYKEYSKFLTQTQIKRVYEEERQIKKNLTNHMKQGGKQRNRTNR